MEQRVGPISPISPITPGNPGWTLLADGSVRRPG